MIIKTDGRSTEEIYEAKMREIPTYKIEKVQIYRPELPRNRHERRKMEKIVGKVK